MLTAATQCPPPPPSFPSPLCLQLVLSDEFTTPNQSFAAGARNPRWTAGDMWYSGTADWEAYKPEQVRRFTPGRRLSCLLA